MRRRQPLHPGQLHLHRRINVILYLNERWDPAWRGSLELWQRDMSGKAREVVPLFNRAVIFNTDATSFHGHPDPLQTPDGVLLSDVCTRLTH